MRESLVWVSARVYPSVRVCVSVCACLSQCERLRVCVCACVDIFVSVTACHSQCVSVSVWVCARNHRRGHGCCRVSMSAGGLGLLVEDSESRWGG